MKKRILIAGHEIGGQMQLLAETLRKKGYQAQAAAFNSDFRNYHNDIQIKTHRIPVQRFFFFIKAIFQYDVFHFFWGVSLLDFWKFKGIDLPLLKLLNKKIIVHFRGTDLVDIKYYNYLQAKARGEQRTVPPKSRPDQLARLAQWRKYADHLLVSTPDLLEIVPEAILVPQVVDVHDVFRLARPTSNKTFRLGHAPTRRNTKGTDFIITAVEQLKQAGLAIELVLIENELPEHVLIRFATCDAGIDQLLIGWYGKVTVELMAMGKPVFCYIDKKYKDQVEGLPVIDVTTDTLQVKLKELILAADQIKRPTETEVLDYMKHHDVNSVIKRLTRLYQTDG